MRRSKKIDVMSVRNKKLIVVLGMHRSGTSVITRGLKVLGVDLGTNLQAAIPRVNDKGFFEDCDVVNVNTDILSFFSHDWHTLSPITRDQLKSKSLSALRLKAIKLLRKKMQSASVFAVKDPRISRLLSFWQDIFDELGIDVSYVIAIRNPLSVAKSLNNRDHIDEEKSCYLWLQHVLPSILETRDKRRIVVDYDKILEQPYIEISRIAKALGLEEEINQSELIKYENEFLSSDLRHAKYDINRTAIVPSIPEGVFGVYRVLLKVASDECSLETNEVLDCVQQSARRLNETSSALEVMSHQYWKNTETNRRTPATVSMSWKTRLGQHLSTQLKKNIRKGFKLLGIKL